MENNFLNAIKTKQIKNASIDELSHNFSQLLYILSQKKLNPAEAGPRERNPLNE